MQVETQKLFDQVAKLDDIELRNFLSCLNLELHLRIVKHLASGATQINQGLYSIPCGETQDEQTTTV